MDFMLIEALHLKAQKEDADAQEAARKDGEMREFRKGEVGAETAGDLVYEKL